MAYNVAQLVKDASNTNTYMTPLEVASTTMTSPNPFGLTNNVFTDFAIIGNFEANKVYYLRFKIHRIPKYFYSGRMSGSQQTFEDADTLNVSLVLSKTPESPTLQRLQIGSFTVPMSEKYNEKNNEYSSYTFIFSPSTNFPCLGFKIQRNKFDAWNYSASEMGYRNWLLTNKWDSASTVSIGENIDIDMSESPTRIYFGNNEFADLCLLNDLVASSEVQSVIDSEKKYWLKIGYQSRPGSVIVVNNEPIIVGRSGIYELNNGTKITSFMIANPGGSNSNKIDAFLLDYAYES